ncbi:heavy-metal-associated domain-containing protein [Heliophilum fasciatum]|uniref:Copper chaperone n=1 Tax=Heliophilum fasciatum TaxID=35700 RepID=A0A4R2RZB3_9FIRM|nr:cation transporter [Heliophilum fasciatum]MCW2276691.1 copper chaperone [Heliophilum fasciatum]TCP68928.1 copper chaperone [Heliophilum fasciatum]
MREVQLHVDGMSCSHCQAAVEKATSAVAGVISSQVDLAAKTVTLQLTDEASLPAICAAIEDIGFDVVD